MVEPAVDEGAGAGSVAGVFISYARVDEPFVEELAAALERRGMSAWVDRQDIAPSTQWRTEIEHGIETAEALLAVVTPASAASEMCRHEVERAETLGKRILPVVRSAPDGTIAAIAERNWIFWRDDSESDSALAQIEQALLVDPEWTKEHTRLLGRALDWERHGRDRNRLLRGADLSAAEAAVAGDRPRGQPQATGLQREYVQASRSGATRRQRLVVTTSLVVAAISITLAVVAFLQFRRANDERARAEDQLRIARSRGMAAQALQLDEFAESEAALLLAAEAARLDPTEEALDALLLLLDTDAGALASLRSADASDSGVAVVASPDGRFEVSDDGRTLTDTTTGEIQVLVDDPDPDAVFLRDIAFSSVSDRVVVSNFTSNEFEVYDLGGGLPAPEVAAFRTDGLIWGADFDGDDRVVGVSASDESAADLFVSVWDTSGELAFAAPIQGALPASFEIEETLVRVSPDRDLGAIVNPHGEVQLFATRTAQFIGPPLPAACTPDCVEAGFLDARSTLARFDGTALETIDASAVARTFDLDVEHWIAAACDLGGRTLTEAERNRFIGIDVAHEPTCVP